ANPPGRRRRCRRAGPAGARRAGWWARRSGRSGSPARHRGGRRSPRDGGYAFPRKMPRQFPPAVVHPGPRSPRPADVTHACSRRRCARSSERTPHPSRLAPGAAPRGVRVSRYPAGSMRLCLVSPYAWDRPSEANDHWAALARALAHRAHEVLVLAPSRKPAMLLEGRRRLRAVANGDAAALAPTPRVPLVVAVGLGVPVGAGSGRVPIPVAVSAGVRLALLKGAFDAVD